MSAKATAVGLYAVLARDWSDFMEFVQEKDTRDEVLLDLSTMLRLPNPKHSAGTVWLNQMGANTVKCELRKRGHAEPSLPTPPTQLEEKTP